MGISIADLSVVSSFFWVQLLPENIFLNKEILIKQFSFSKFLQGDHRAVTPNVSASFGLGFQNFLFLDYFCGVLLIPSADVFIWQI